MTFRKESSYRITGYTQDSPGAKWEQVVVFSDATHPLDALRDRLEIERRLHPERVFIPWKVEDCHSPFPGPGTKWNESLKAFFRNERHHEGGTR